jgi:hypothetical protein
LYFIYFELSAKGLCSRSAHVPIEYATIQLVSKRRTYIPIADDTTRRLRDDGEMLTNINVVETPT